MRVLIACEFSGTVRRAFRSLGHDAWSCDLLRADDRSLHHHQRDCLDIIHNCGPWDLMIAHPPCTYLASSGLHWNGRVPGRAEKTEEALEFVRALMDAPVPRIAIENPIGCISSRIRKPDQVIQPWHFGDDASKATCLWLKNLPLLKDTNRLPGDNKTRRANQTPSGQNKLGPSPDRWKLRSVTYPGFAAAMASQWGQAEIGGDLFNVDEVYNMWQRVRFQAECDPDGDGWCKVRDIDPAECDCIGPTQEGVEYREVNGVLEGRFK